MATPYGAYGPFKAVKCVVYFLERKPEIFDTEGKMKSCAAIRVRETLHDLKALGPHNMIGPDLFGFLAQEVADLLSQDEDILPSSIESEAGSMPIRVMNSGKGSESIANPSFENSLGATLPNLKRELLMALLRQIVSNFTQEVDEMLDPVIRIRQMLSLLKGRKNNSGRKIVQGLRAGQGSHKKLKVSASSSLAGIPAQQSMINHGSDKEMFNVPCGCGGGVACWLMTSIFGLAVSALNENIRIC
ncbi:hypothetical protein AKJ16_DCAP26023 [Drosera capensis]